MVSCQTPISPHSLKGNSERRFKLTSTEKIDPESSSLVQLGDLQVFVTLIRIAIIPRRLVGHPKDALSVDGKVFSRSIGTGD
jgi:hypothetical protein